MAIRPPGNSLFLFFSNGLNDITLWSMTDDHDLFAMIAIDGIGLAVHFGNHRLGGEPAGWEREDHAGGFEGSGEHPDEREDHHPGEDG